MRKKYFLGIFSLLFIVVFSLSALSLSETIRPNGNGYWNQWLNTGCPSTLEYLCVNEVTPDTTDYLYTSANDKKETFSFGNSANINDSSSVDSVDLIFYAQDMDTVDACFEAIIRISSTDYSSSTVACATSSWADYTFSFTTNPVTGIAWKKSEIDSLEAGMKSKDPNGGGKIATVKAIVNYH